MFLRKHPLGRYPDRDGTVMVDEGPGEDISRVPKRDPTGGAAEGAVDHTPLFLIEAPAVVAMGARFGFLEHSHLFSFPFVGAVSQSTPGNLFVNEIMIEFPDYGKNIHVRS